MEGTEIQILGLSPLRDVSTLGAVITVSDRAVRNDRSGPRCFHSLVHQPRTLHSLGKYVTVRPDGLKMIHKGGTMSPPSRHK